MSVAPNEETTEDKVVSLEDAIRQVKIAAADRGDVVVDLREAATARLELLAKALAGQIAAVPEDDHQFDFAISSGQNPRFFIDATAHVGLARDRMTYRFLKDTRHGRVILSETRSIPDMADKVTHYVAERIVERQRMMEGDIRPALAPAETPSDQAEKPAPADSGLSDFMLGLIWFLIGVAIGGGVLFYVLTQTNGVAG